MKKIAVLAGDGIGPEVMAEAIKALRKVGDFEYIEALVGGAAFEKFGEHFPAETRQVCESADAILFGSVGGPVGSTDEKWQNCEANSILTIRKAFDFNINFRPVITYVGLPCVLKNPGKVDILCVRELSSGIYFGKHDLSDDHAFDEMRYTKAEIESVARMAFCAAQYRRKKVTSVDKANVLACSKLWRKIVDRVANDFPDIEYEHMLVDNAAMQVLKRPSGFDVLLMPNMFGDILSDELSVLSGSLGMVPSASTNDKMFGLYEPAGGSAQDIAGKGVANPIGMILSAGMMLRYSFNMDKEYEAIMRAVETALRAGYRTADIAYGKAISTSEMGDKIIFNLTKP